MTKTEYHRKWLGPMLTMLTSHSFLLILGFSMGLPFLWMVLTSFKQGKDVQAKDWVPGYRNEVVVEDFTDSATLLSKWKNPSDSVSVYIRSKFSDKTREALDKADLTQPPSEKLLDAVITDLNGAVIPAVDFYEPSRFAHLELEPDVVKLIEIKKQARMEVDERARMNRLLLQSAYGPLIVKSEHRVFQTENYPNVFKELRYGALKGVKAGHWKWWQYFTKSAFVRYYFNSLFIAGWVTLLQCLTSTMAAFAFSRLRWRGRDKVFLMYLATMMIPGLVLMIPNYQIMMKLGWVDSYAGLIIPGAFSTFGTFLLRQFMLTIPRSLDEAAEIDGASKWQVFWEVIMPLARPGLIVLVIFTFMGSYRSFFWPLILIKTQAKYTLPVGLLYFDSSMGSQTQLMMAAVVMSVVPLIILFVVLQKYLIKGIQLGAVKG